MSAEDIHILDPNQYGTDFYCGYLPAWWREKYNNTQAYRLALDLSTPLNNRNSSSANVTSGNELNKIVKAGEAADARIYLVLNAKYYPDYVYDDIQKYVNEVMAIGIRRMIVCDVGMISFLNDRFPTLRLSVSCLAQATNTKAVGFYSQFGNVERIVFPRHMSIPEIKAIAVAHPALEFEFFIFSNRCLFDDGYCRGVHEFTPICKDLFSSEYYGVSGTPLEDKTICRLREDEFEYRSWTRNENHAVARGYCTPSFACSACSLPDLMPVANIISVKLSIRGHGIQERLHQVEMAREAINAASKHMGKMAIQAVVSEKYGKQDLCQIGMACMMR